jgi:hypothetical protein
MGNTCISDGVDLSRRKLDVARNQKYLPSLQPYDLHRLRIIRRAPNSSTSYENSQLESLLVAEQTLLGVADSSASSLLKAHRLLQQRVL